MAISGRVQSHCGIHRRTRGGLCRISEQQGERVQNLSLTVHDVGENQVRI